jgi:uncharacterized membrane protein
MLRTFGQPLLALHPAALGLRRISTADVRAALAAGWSDFLAAPTQLVFLGMLYPLVGLIGARVAAQRDLLPLLWPLVAGLGLIGSFSAVGLYEISRRREAGETVSWLSAFAVLRNPNLSVIIGLGLILLSVFVLWVGIAMAVFDRTLGPLGVTTPGAILHAALTTPAGHRLLWLSNGIGAVLALGVLATTVVAVPLALDRGSTLGTAVRTSIGAFVTNPGPLLLWGAIVAALLALGCLPAFTGLAVVMPVLGHATWHLYRRLVV